MVLAIGEVQLRPYVTTLKEGPAPMATYETDLKKVFARREMGGNEIKDLEWDAVYGNEGVIPFAYNPQCGRGILLKLRDLFKSETQRRSGWCYRRRR